MLCIMLVQLQQPLPINILIYPLNSLLDSLMLGYKKGIFRATVVLMPYPDQQHEETHLCFFPMGEDPSTRDSFPIITHQTRLSLET